MILTPTRLKGRSMMMSGCGPLMMSGQGGIRHHNDAGDSMSGGVYSHDPLEKSATEDDEWASWIMFVQEMLGASDVVPVRNETGGELAAGTLVYVSGWDNDTARFLITEAQADDPQKLAEFVLEASIGDDENGLAFKQHLVTGLDTSAYSKGDWIYLSDTPGEFAASEGTFPMAVGRVEYVDATAGRAAFALNGLVFRPSLLAAMRVTQMHECGAALTSEHTHSCHTNENATGEVEVTLPTAVAGLTFEFVVQAAQSLKIVANTGDTIRRTVSVSGSGGYIRSSTVGDYLRLRAINSTEWVAVAEYGSWTIDS